MPNFHQLVDFPTRGNNILDQVYCNIAKGYKASPSPHLGQSDHISLSLTPAYRPFIAGTRPTVRTVTVWPEGGMERLQNCFEETDWNIFKQTATHCNYVNLNTYSTSVMDYITFCMDSVTTHQTIRTLPNYKPSMNRAVSGLLRDRDAAFHSGDAEAYRTARSRLRKGIKVGTHWSKEYHWWHIIIISQRIRRCIFDTMKANRYQDSTDKWNYISSQAFPFLK